MGLRQRLEAEAQARSAQLALRSSTTHCVFCSTTSVGKLRLTQFVWRKQVGRSADHHVRIEHISMHLLCEHCLKEIVRRRKWFWPIRYAGGVGLAGGLCGVVTVPALLYLMKLSNSERQFIFLVGLVSAILLVVGLVALAVARRCSVPPTLLDMTGNGWECVSLQAVDAQGQVNTNRCL